MLVRAELRALLEEQVKAAEEAYEGALGVFNEARNALFVSFDDLIRYQRALEAATRGTNNPYNPPSVHNPLETGKAEEQEKESESRIVGHQQSKRRVLRPTKKGIILAALSSGNGTGMKMDEVLRAIPADAPIKITKADLYRALPRLVSEEKAWRDVEGFYRAGQPSTLMEHVAEASIDD